MNAALAYATSKPKYRPDALAITSDPLQACNQETSSIDNKANSSQEIPVNCTQIKTLDYGNLAVLENLDQPTATERASEYLTYVSCQKKFPEVFFNAPLLFYS